MKGNILGLGFMSIKSLDTAINTIKYALSILPTNDNLLVNTAQYYGDGMGSNEKILGKALGMLDGNEHKRIVVVTKGGVNHFSLEIEDDMHNLVFPEPEKLDAYQDANTFKYNFYLSRKNLGLDKHQNVRLGYILHRHHYDQIKFKEQLDVLAELYATNMVSYVGLSEVSYSDLVSSHTYLLSKGGRLHFLESEFSMNVQFLLDQHLPYCQINQIRVLGYSPLSRGFWTDQHPDIMGDTYRLAFNMWKDGNYQKLLPMLNSVRDFSKKKNKKTEQVALAWIRSKNVIPIPGSSTFANNKVNIDSYSLILEPCEVNELDNYCFDMTKKYGIKRYS